MEEVEPVAFPQRKSGSALRKKLSLLRFLSEDLDSPMCSGSRSAVAPKTASYCEDSLEQSINKWLDEEGVFLMDPAEREQQHYQRKRSMIFSCFSEDDTPQPKNKSEGKSRFFSWQHRQGSTMDTGDNEDNGENGDNENDNDSTDNGIETPAPRAKSSFELKFSRLHQRRSLTLPRLSIRTDTSDQNSDSEGSEHHSGTKSPGVDLSNVDPD